jgi:hypothetical protein
MHRMGAVPRTSREQNPRRNPVTDTPMETRAEVRQADDRTTYIRFDISQRIEHSILVIFLYLRFTGLIQKFSAYQVSDTLIFILGGLKGC